MNDDAASLDRLHDIVLPAPVSWWPPAPGWYVVLAVLVALALLLAHRRWVCWRANAYRREALRALRTTESGPAIASLLRRTALAVAPRRVVASRSGAAWLDWLSAHGPDPMPDVVRTQLGIGLYDPQAAAPDLSALREYAGRWITHHRPPAESSGDNPC